MTAVEFGDGREPWSVARGKVKRWMHALVRDTTALPAAWQTELREWLADRDATVDIKSLLVTRGEGGYAVHVSGSRLSVELTDLPAWLQQPTPEPEPVKAKRPPRARADAG